MKKIAKELLIVVVALCATVGAFTALAGMPFWFGNLFGFNNNVPNAGLNTIFNPFGGMNFGGAGNPGGAQQQNLTVFLTNTNILPANPTKVGSVKLTFKNTGTEERWVTWLTNAGAANPAQALIQPGGSFVASPTLTVPGKYDFEISAANSASGSSSIWSITIVAPAGGAAGGGATTVAPGAGAGGAGGAAGGGAVAAGGGVMPPAGVVPQQNATVNINNAALDPAVVNLQVGGNVTWKNNLPNAVKISSTGIAAGLFAKDIPAGGTWTFNFTHPIAGLTYETSVPLLKGTINVFGPGAAGGAGAQQVLNVSILGAGPNPVLANGMLGAKVVWTNNTNINRTITAFNGGTFSSPAIAPGATYSFTFNTAGIWKYQISDPVAALIGGVSIQ